MPREKNELPSPASGRRPRVFVIDSPHDFENRTAKRAGALNLSVPGDFEEQMAGIAEWFRERPAAASRTASAPRSKSR